MLKLSELCSAGRIPAFLMLGCAFFFSSAAQAAGFYLQEQSVSAMGSAYAGATATPRDASVNYYNPAAMTGLSGTRINIGGNLIVPKADLSDAGSTVGGAPIAAADSDNPVNPVLLPNIHIATPVYNDTIWVGLSVAAPFGLSSEYNPNWAGRYDSIKSDLQTVDVQASGAVRLHEKLSVGGGLDVQNANAELTSAVTNGVTEGLSRLEGDDVSLGWNAGIYLQPSDGTRMGFHYRSEVHHTLDGRVIVGGVVGLNENSGGKANLDLPDIATAAIAQDIGDRWTLLGQATWFGWNDFQDITVTRNDGTVASTTVQNYQATLNLAAGAEYKWSDAATFRAGYQFDETPTGDEYRTTRTPDGDRHWFAAGATMAIDDALSLDLAAAYIVLREEEIRLSRNGGLAQVNINRGDSSIGIVSLAVNRKF